MAVKQVPAKFSTSDGREFKTEKEAERHEEQIIANREFESARLRLAQAIARSQKTADGEEFEFGWRDYWFVTQSHKHMPTLFSVQFGGWYNMKFRFDDNGDVSLQEDRNGDKGGHFSVGDLYKSKAKATAALRIKQAEYIAQCQAELTSEPCGF